MPQIVGTPCFQSQTAFEALSGFMSNYGTTGKSNEWIERMVLSGILTLQGSIIGWCHNHRVHHKFSDTDADPHNARRGFFYSHIGWLLVRFHPLVVEKRKTVDMSDLANDPILAFQKKYFLILMPITCFILPAVIPVYFWGETWNISFYLNIFRYLVVVHSAFMINSWAHTFGTKPYDRYVDSNWKTFRTVIYFQIYPTH